MTNLNILSFFPKIQKIKYFAVPCTVYYRTLPFAGYTAGRLSRFQPQSWTHGDRLSQRRHSESRRQHSAVSKSLEDTSDENSADVSTGSLVKDKDSKAKKAAITHEMYWTDDQIRDVDPNLIVKGVFSVSKKLTHNAYVSNDKERVKVFGFLARNRALDGDHVVGIKARRSKNDEIKKEDGCRIIQIVSRSSSLDSIVVRIKVQDAKDSKNLVHAQPLRSVFPGFIIDKQSIGKEFLNAIETARPDGWIFAVLRFTKWSKDEMKARGIITKMIGDTLIPNNQMTAVMISHNLDYNGFPDNMLSALRESIAQAEASKHLNRTDMKDLYVMSIDPQDAKDLDDALSIVPIHGPDGSISYEIGVHIADVTHYTKPNCPIDLYAQKRATTVYLDHGVFPMLPRKLSEELCSLSQGSEKLCFSVMVKIGEKEKGEKIGIDTYITTPAEFKLTSIVNRARLDYKSARERIYSILNTWSKETTDLVNLSFKDFEDALMTKKLTKLNRSIMRLYFISQKCRRYRLSNLGAISLNLTGWTELQIPKVTPGNENIFTGIDGKSEHFMREIKEEQESHELIEEMMLMANTQVAKFLAKNLHVHMLRIHPDTDTAVKMAILSRIPDDIKRDIKADSLKATKILQECEKHMESGAFMNLCFSGFSEFKAALYKAHGKESSIGHWGLAYDLYLHFTSPIRRYADILVHRMLKSILFNEELENSYLELEKACEHCNVKSKAADDAETDYRDMALNQYLKYIPSLVPMYSESILSENSLEMSDETWGYLYKDARIFYISTTGEKKQVIEDFNKRKVFITFYIPILKTTRTVSCTHLKATPTFGKCLKPSVTQTFETIINDKDAHSLEEGGEEEGLIRLDNLTVLFNGDKRDFSVDQRTSLLLVPATQMWTVKLV
ncbi:hypothetical protein BEWA_030520 [Theileria equi strain WA]|uniref:RNB domain-containing protein n=1 Tax=Theileria equi strain WA TaxID=1537102 RepID=L0AXA8_THEEQ|nr:hypothetical protein BEWA_030520 [Theileria equi strain WA]AFZ80200.1 hypothetical protein BEWA_030520 [Theileria equi strain WA]|eukprot:XP_004829866.1 hypothetical protein BEWA_030520 [Theileria equi strain WA]